MKICFSDQKPILTNNSIFLAGPTRRDSHYDYSWRKTAVDILYEKTNFDGVIYIPELYEKRKFENREIEKQTRWEWDCLDAAGIIVFWVPRELPDMPAFTTNIEFGIYTEKKPKQIVLGYPENAEKMRYLKQRYDAVVGRKIHHTLENTLIEAVKQLDFFLER